MFPLPPGFPKPPFFQEEEEDGGEEETDGDFRRKMESEGFNPDLVEMGIKVAKNHMRPPEEAFKIGENYIKEMAK